MTTSFAKQSYRLVRRGWHWVRDILLRPEPMFRLYLRFFRGVTLAPKSQPHWQPCSGVLKSRNQWQAALDQVNSLGLPRHPDPPKNWDSLTAIAQILSETNCNCAHLRCRRGIVFQSAPVALRVWLSESHRHQFGVFSTFTARADLV